MSAAGNRSRRMGRLVVDLIMLGLTGVGAWYVWPTVLGGSSQAIVVHGHSMEPTYGTGDLVMVDTDAVPAVGKIVVLKIPSDEPGGGQLVVHRIVGMRDDGTYITQGDASENPDDFLTARSDILGSPRFSIPHGGQAIGLVATPLGLSIVAGLLSTVLLWPRKRPPELAAAGVVDGGAVADVEAVVDARDFIDEDCRSRTSLAELVATSDSVGVAETVNFTESMTFTEQEMADARAWLHTQISPLVR